MAGKISIDMQELQNNFNELKDLVNDFDEKIGKLVAHFTTTSALEGQAATAATENIFKLGLESQDFVFMLSGINEEMCDYVHTLVELNKTTGKYMDSIS
ncbi:hypothetical protein [Isobaculum melis]|uniref:Uncharacterized protein n=1 Tax=Isobaculum melis TaxID=142588 RepID=A0A1H9UJN4_9LACT|nr:hypothetical protein [Isobaculum melis]SES09404.1 hypothetical protein SAMN04488559_1334 [Isobaculum melis]